MADAEPSRLRRVPRRRVAVLIAVAALLVALASARLAVISVWWPGGARDPIAVPVGRQLLAGLGYGGALLAGAWLGTRIFYTAVARRLARAATGAALVVVLCHLGELGTAVAARGDAASQGGGGPGGGGSGGGGSGAVLAGQAFAATKWSLLLPVALVAATGVVTTLRRALRRRPMPPPPVIRPAVDEDTGLSDPSGRHDQRASWRANSTLPDSTLPDSTLPDSTLSDSTLSDSTLPDSTPSDSVGTDGAGPAVADGPGPIGFCVSGGGIRAATFALGALDSLRDVLVRARWLVSVSGGGYATGAMRLALQRLDPGATADGTTGWRSVAQPRDVYLPGSSELDFTRRHGRYLTDGAREWVGFAVTVARGFLVNVATLGLLVALAARVLAHGYAWLAPGLLGTWPPPAAPLWAVGVLTTTWLVLFTAAVMIEPASLPVTRLLRAAGSAALVVAALVGLAGAGLPLLAWAVTSPPTWITWGSPTITLGGGYLAALIALGRQTSTRAAVARAVGGGTRMWRTAGAGGRAVLAALLVYAGLLVVLAGYLLLFAGVLAHTGAVTRPAGWLGNRAPEWAVTVAVAAALGVLATVDQVRWSLHPFYRRRLASAFAVRRLRNGGRVRAEPYDYDVETTYLHRYGSRVDGFPEVIFSCAAHVSGQRVAPPGRRVMPWTFSASYVGSQAHGWVATGPLCRAVSPALQHDLTVQGAQAISGAALASQMGARHQVYSKFLTLTNIRLGSWLPNPAYLHQLPARSAPEAWAWPRLPRRRRLTTLLREFVGAFPAEHPLVFLTDGAHYENLGLVELLRRRPSVVYCLDASGGPGNAPHTLGRAMELAYEELGVTIDLPEAPLLGAGRSQPHPAQPHPAQPHPAQPHPAQPGDQLTAGLLDRLAPACVVTGSISYPDLGPGLPAAIGLLIVGRAALTATTPFPVLTYAGENRGFPVDSASDQWFDAAQFDAYHSLGRHVGDLMRKHPAVSTDRDEAIAVREQSVHDTGSCAARLDVG